MSTSPQVRRKAVSILCKVALVSSVTIGTVVSVAPPASAVPFSSGNVVVLRVGDGAAALSNASTAVFLDEFAGTGGAPVQSLALPTSTTGSNRPLTMSGSATSEGALVLSENGGFLTVGGYAAAPGIAAVSGTTAAAQNRVVGRIDGNSNIDTSTSSATAHSGNNIRGAVTTDGTKFWSAGGAGGLQYSASLGVATSTQVTTTTNIRVPIVANGQMYFSTGSGTAGIYAVGVPATGTAVTPTLVAPSASPYSFAVLDRDPSVAGVDTLYIADDNATTGGILKLSFDGAKWASRGRVAPPAGVQLRGLAARIASGGVELFATSPTDLYALTDTAAFNATISATLSASLANAGANKGFRGVAFAPTGGSATAPTITSQPANASASVGTTATLTVAANGTAPVNYQWYQGTAPDTAAPVGTNAPTFTTPTLTAVGAFPFWVRVSNTVGPVDSQTATVTVTSGTSNTAPTISPKPVTPVGFTLGDTVPVVRSVAVADAETPPEGLTTSAVSSAPSIATAVITGTGASRTIEVTPVGVGLATITITVTDSGSIADTTTFSVAVSAAELAGTRNHYGISDASTAIDLGGGTMVLGDDETNSLRIYPRTASGLPSLVFDPLANGLTIPDVATNEMDIEASARVGNTIYWVGSLGQNSSGNTRPNRQILFTTTVTGTGPTATLAVAGSYRNLRTDLLTWDAANGNALGLATAATLPPESGGLNVEGAEFAPDGTTLYLGFRSPLGASNRALVVPVTNPAAIVAANPTPSVPAAFGSAFTLDLGGRGIREIRKNAANQYLILAGPTGVGSTFAMYSWNGVSTAAPVLLPANLSDLVSDGSVESIVEVPNPLTPSSVVQLLTDSGDTVWYANAVINKDLTTTEFRKVRSASLTIGSAAPCFAPLTHTIPQIQGTGAATTVTGTVTVQGVVVGDYEGPSPKLRGFYLQDATGDANPASSDGIFIFNGADTDVVSLGSVVQVTGVPSEFQGQTQITATTIESCTSTGSVIPTDLAFPVANPTALEAYEGMLVRIPQTMTVTEHFQLGRFGQVTVSANGRQYQPTQRFASTDPQRLALQNTNALSRIIIDDATQDQNADPIFFGRNGAPLSVANPLRTGDTLNNVVGLMTYTWAGNAASPNNYRLRPVNALTGSASFTSGNARPASPPAVGGSTKVAGFNLLNYFNTFGIGNCTFGVGGTAADCRGANNQTEFDRQSAKTVAAITKLGADIVGLVEMENDGYGSASAIQDLVTRLNAAEGAGTWAYINPDTVLGANSVSTDAIKSAFIYKPTKVTPAPTKVFSPTTSTTFERRPLAQTFSDTTGKTYSVVVNHFKSKSCAGGTGTDADQNDGQGCFNARRVSQANALVSFINTTVIPGAEDSDVLVVGDLNSYAKEDPVNALTGAGYTDLIVNASGPDAYSYLFNGEFGTLDYALANNALLPQITGAGDFHINADEPTVLDYNIEFKTSGQITSLYAADEFRVSDHDPVLVGIAGGETVLPTISIATPTASQTLPSKPVSISGNATDNAGVARVELYIYRNVAGGQWWDGTAWQATPARLLATLGSPNGVSTSWTYSFLPTESGGVYAVAAVGIDTSGNYTVTPSVLFNVADTEDPTVTIAAPVSGAAISARPVTISGTAADNSGVVEVQLVLYRPVGSGQFWNGTAWQSSYTAVVATLVSSGGQSTTWSYSFNPPQSGGLFYVSALAIDTSYRYSFTTFNSFTLPDSVVPSATVTTPTNNSSSGSPVNVTGTASDNEGIAAVGAVVYRVTDGKFWNGSIWQAGFAYVLATIASPGSSATNWSYTFSPSDPGTYLIAGLAIDTNYGYSLSEFNAVTVSIAS
jgi:predicted extracellular nuclease